ncbi:hypothetical protein HYX09_03955 [Candidatus Woesearchaeota archaeon]|nr:hypothetical protein [Candidatus Woesearchaeota archaeon]MBI2661393.1 hypothetical protein [Candidatus Woesearchaeota archaeon]
MDKFKHISCLASFLILAVLLIPAAYPLKSESTNYKTASTVISVGGETTESTNYRNIASIGIISGEVTSGSYKTRLGFIHTVLNADGQPCTSASQCEGGFCCSNSCSSSSCPVSVPPSGGGAGGAGDAGTGGGGGVIIEEALNVSDFSIDTSSLHFELALGDSQSKQFVVSNTGTNGLRFSVSLAGESQYIQVPDRSFSLEPGQQKNVIVSASGNRIGSYIGEITIESEGTQKKITFVLDVSSTEVLFDVKLDILSQYKQVVPGGTLRMQASLINIGAGSNSDVTATYLIKDSRGYVLHESSESFLVEKQKSYLKEIRIPESAKFGNYIAVIEVRYANSFAVSSELFSVVEKVQSPSFIRAVSSRILSNVYYTLIAISAAAIFVLYIISRAIPRRHE